MAPLITEKNSYFKPERAEQRFQGCWQTAYAKIGVGYPAWDQWFP